MKKFPVRQFIIIFLIIVLIGVIAFFVYPVINNRYFSKSDAPAQNNAPIAFRDLNETAKQMEQAVPPVEENPALPGEENAAPPKENKRNVKTFITRDNCDNNCKSFEADSASLTYCQQVCGIAPVQENPNCDGKADLEKDYCQKDLAITKTDAALCESVKDDNIRQTCKNRVAEDLMEKVQTGSDEALR